MFTCLKIWIDNLWIWESVVYESDCIGHDVWFCKQPLRQRNRNVFYAFIYFCAFYLSFILLFCFILFYYYIVCLYHPRPKKMFFILLFLCLLFVLFFFLCFLFYFIVIFCAFFFFSPSFIISSHLIQPHKHNINIIATLSPTPAHPQ